MFHAVARVLAFEKDGGKIAQIEAKNAMLLAVLTRRVLWIDNQKPPHPTEEAIWQDAGKIWRAREMGEADYHSLLELYGKNVPIVYTTNSPTEGIPTLTRRDAQNRFVRRAQGRVQDVRFTPSNLLTPADEIVISGSSNESNAKIREQIQQAVQGTGKIRDTRFTTPENFAKNLPWSKVYENTLVTGNYTSPDHLIPKPPIINIVDAQGSYGDLSQAALLILHAIMHDTYVLLHISNRDTATNDDFLAFQSMLRELVVIFPETVKHVRITQSLDELTQCVQDIREARFPQTSLRRNT